MIFRHLKIIEKIIDNNYWTNWLGISRSLLSFSLLMTLLFNNKLTLFYSGIQNENYPKFSNIEFNLFSWFNNLETGVIISVIILTFVMIGIFPKYTCIPHWFVTYSFSITSACNDGGDQVASIITLLLIPICLLDTRRWHWSKTQSEKTFIARTIATLSYFLICFQIFVIYFFASVGKFKMEEWKNGTAIYYWLTQPLFGATNFYKPFIDLILFSPILTTFFNWSVLFLELIIAFSLFSTNKKYRGVILIIGITFHFFILLFLGIVTFSITMSACLILFLISKNNNYEYRNFCFNPFVNRFRNIVSFSAKKN
ncbi:sporulation-delaying protein SdpB family protein [Flavobacterium sp. ZB4R12]|uniref:sporulation-delaying protein SdpB family protein n=1 Tax=Flavobacterium sp. ZB4R12 TaxID=3398732 RepID=UPI003AAFAC62